MHWECNTEYKAQAKLTGVDDATFNILYKVVWPVSTRADAILTI